MSNEKERGQQQSNGQNPTLNAPGSKVNDYGNETGGSGSGIEQKIEEKVSQAPQQSSQNEGTIGNP